MPPDGDRSPNSAAITPTVDDVESRRLAVAAFMVLLVLVSIVVVAVTAGPDRTDETASTSTVISDAVVDDFLADFEASLTGTFVVDSVFERRRGEELLANSEQTVVRRGADHLTFRQGSVAGQLDSRVVTCEGAGDEVSCLAGENEVDVEAEIAEQVATVRDYVDGPELVYGVSAIDPQEITRLGGETDRCYTLELLRQLRLPPYGTYARFCFDAATAAPTLLRIERPEAIDQTAATAVRTTVTDEDLDPLA
jgi:hypothetical protein